MNKYERVINKILDMQQSKSIGDLHIGDKIIDGEIAVKMFNNALELIKYIIRKELKNEAVTYVIYTNVEKLVEVRRVFLTEKEYEEELTKLKEDEEIVTLNTWSIYKLREIDTMNRVLNIDNWDDL